MNNCEQHFFAKSPKRRIHEQDYAQKVVQHITADKQSIVLNESLFNAKVAAKQSSTLIKDVQKDVKQALRKYDNFVRNSDSFRKTTERFTQSSYNIKPKIIEEDEKQKQQSLLLQLTDRQKLSEQVIEEESSKCEKELFNTNNISPIKENKSQFQWTRAQYNQSTPLPSKQKKSQSLQKQGSDTKNSYRKIHIPNQKESRQSKPLTSRVSGIMERNTEWKQRIQEKISIEQKKKAENEMKDCTFKPKISGQQKNNRQYNKSVSKEFQTEIKEIMHIIDDLNLLKLGQKNK